LDDFRYLLPISAIQRLFSRGSRLYVSRDTVCFLSARKFYAGEEVACA